MANIGTHAHDGGGVGNGREFATRHTVGRGLARGGGCVGVLVGESSHQQTCRVVLCLRLMTPLCA